MDAISDSATLFSRLSAVDYLSECGCEIIAPENFVEQTARKKVLFGSKIGLFIEFCIKPYIEYIEENSQSMTDNEYKTDMEIFGSMIKLWGLIDKMTTANIHSLYFYEGNVEQDILNIISTADNILKLQLSRIEVDRNSLITTFAKLAVDYYNILE